MLYQLTVLEIEVTRTAGADIIREKRDVR